MPPVRYGYFRGLKPPAPFLHVRLRNLPGTGELTDVPAQIDTGADHTVLPQKLVDELGLLPVDEIIVAGLGGAHQALKTYAVHVAIHDLPPVVVEALAHPDERWVLLGRDVLNGFRVLLDGPGLALEIG